MRRVTTIFNTTFLMHVWYAFSFASKGKTLLCCENSFCVLSHRKYRENIKYTTATCGILSSWGWSDKRMIIIAAMHLLLWQPPMWSSAQGAVQCAISFFIDFVRLAVSEPIKRRPDSDVNASVVGETDVFRRRKRTLMYLWWQNSPMLTRKVMGCCVCVCVFTGGIGWKNYILRLQKHSSALSYFLSFGSYFYLSCDYKLNES